MRHTGRREWLFATATSGAIVAIATKTLQTHSVPFFLPSLSQLTVRLAG